MNFRKNLLLVGHLEGISFLILLFIAMPLKYVWGEPWMVQKVGMLHGLLFVLYIALTYLEKDRFKWNVMQTLIALFMSVLPFGTVYVVRKMLPNES
jgi:integral membrane protein